MVVRRPLVGLGSDGGGREPWPWIPWAVGLTLLLTAAILGGLFYVLAPPTWQAPPSGQDTGTLLARTVNLDQATARPYLGITYQEVTAAAGDHLAMPAGVGTLLTSIAPSSPAAMAGLNVGDVILAVDGQTVSRESPLLKLLLNRRPGERMRLMVQRGRDHLTIEVVLGKR